MNKVVNIDRSEHKTQNQEALEFIKSGTLEDCNKMLILGVNDENPDDVRLSYFHAGCEPEQLLTMIEGLKERILYLLGYK